MRIVAFLFFACLTGTAFTQGLEESYDVECLCWTITNHYDNGHMSSQHRENFNRERHGESLVYNSNGQLVRRENWKNGKLDGPSYSYHPDGSVSVESYFDAGRKTGVWKFMQADGTLIQTVHYTGNGPDGVYDFYHAGVKYLQQRIENAELVENTIINQELFDLVQEEASATGKN